MWFAVLDTLRSRLFTITKTSPFPSKGGGRGCAVLDTLRSKFFTTKKIFYNFYKGESPWHPTSSRSSLIPPPLEGKGEVGAGEAIVSLIVGIFFYVLAGRGGLQLRPLTPIVATQYVSDMRLAPIVSNTTMNFLVSMQFQYLEEPTYFSQEILDKEYSLQHPADTSHTFTPYNVVVIALESFGKEFSAQYNTYEGYTPFLDSISDYGYTCEQSYANGLRSTQGIVAITAGIPALMNDPLMISAYQSNQIESLASLLRKKGYETGFFHGSNVGSMEFEKYAKLAGFQHFYDRRAFPDQTQYDGNWGIWDAPFFQFFAQTLEKDYKQPFLGFIFSLTSHHPFRTEAWFEAQYPNLDPVNRSVLYTDYALRKFFETAQKMPWYSNTLFVICADHTGVSTHAEYQTKEGKYRVPIVFLPPSPSKGGGGLEAPTLQVPLHSTKKETSTIKIQSATPHTPEGDFSTIKPQSATLHPPLQGRGKGGGSSLIKIQSATPHPPLQGRGNEGSSSLIEIQSVTLHPPLQGRGKGGGSSLIQTQSATPHPPLLWRGKGGGLSQIDILPSILDYLHYDLPYPAFGTSIFEGNNFEDSPFEKNTFQDSFFVEKGILKKIFLKKRYNYNYFDGVYQIMDGQYILLFDGKENLGLFDYLLDPNLQKNIALSSPEATQRLERQLKLVLQRHHVAMMRNELGG
ncbi:MAG: hypothetical protein RLZZ292_1565 [Bacteroidota bacterium]|jgi:hypothetical protein